MLAEGIHRLTTTRVARRAGVSVGTMYQYFPHKQALIYALNERYLAVLAERMEAACKLHHGATAAQMVEAVVNAYWDAKTERSDVTRALYRSAVELDNEALIKAFARRMDAAMLGMLATASDGRNVDVQRVSATLLAVIFGTVRNVFEQNLGEAAQADIRGQLILMCTAYLGAPASLPATRGGRDSRARKLA